MRLISAHNKVRGIGFVGFGDNKVCGVRDFAERARTAFGDARAMSENACLMRRSTCVTGDFSGNGHQRP
ncbi:hypothetical protein OKW42_000513 [Paraburkholderia sp. WC7.3d]